MFLLVCYFEESSVNNTADDAVSAYFILQKGALCSFSLERRLNDFAFACSNLEIDYRISKFQCIQVNGGISFVRISVMM